MARQKRRSCLASLDECGEALRELGLLDLRIEAIEARCDRKILDAKSLAKEAASFHLTRKRELEGDLEMYYREHQAEIEADGRKSVELPVGSMGRRKSSELKPLPKKTWADVLAVIQRRGLEQFLAVKKKVDKEALRSQTDGFLDKLGCRLVPKQTWWYEVDRTKLEAE